MNEIAKAPARAHMHRSVAADPDLARRGLAAMLAVSDALRAWRGFREGSERLLADMCTTLGLLAGILWIANGEALERRAVWSGAAAERRVLESAPRAVPLLPGSGVGARAMAERRPVGPEPVGYGAGRPRRPNGRLAFGVPLLAGEEALGAVELHAPPALAGAELFIAVLDAVGHDAGCFLGRRRGELALSPLTARELEVLALTADGHTRERLAQHLAIAPTTVKTHLEHIYEKLGVSDRTAAVALALRTGLIE